MNETVEVDRDYLWALEVLALDYLQDKAEYDEYQKAKDVVNGANPNRPRDRNAGDSTRQRGTGARTQGQRR